MTYFCSDLHGEYEAFCRLLDKISFGGGDTMYILGDFVDKGKASLPLARLIMEEEGFKALCGNHEYYFLKHYAFCVDEYEAGLSEDLWKSVAEYFPEARAEEMPEIADFLETLPFYFEEKDFICVHAGLELDKNGAILPMQEQDRNYLLFDRNFKEKNVVPVNGKTVLFGHTPCSYENGTGKFIKTLKSGIYGGTRLTDYSKIRLDTGAALTGMVGCLRKEDMREIYIKTR